jgi:hypothetical protein
VLEILLKLGLSDKEARVYLATLELGQDTVQNIAEKSEVNRATTYVILEKLLGLGLVSTIEKGKKTLFIAENPTELGNLLEDQKRDIEKRKKYLDEAMGELQALYDANPNKPTVRYFEGADGLEALDRYGKDEMKPGSEIISLLPIDLIEEQFPTRRKVSVGDRVQKKIKARSIYTHKDGEIPGYVNEKELREGIFLPREELPLGTTIQVVGDWAVKFFSFNPDNYFGILVLNSEIARNMKLLLELAWKGAEAKSKELKEKK